MTSRERWMRFLGAVLDFMCSGTFLILLLIFFVFVFIGSVLS